MGVEKRREAARRRWAVLARALRGQFCGGDRNGRGGRGSLVKVSPIEGSPGWWDYSVGEYSVRVTYVPPRPLSLLLGSTNNTGNVRVWESEEALAIFTLSHLDMFKDRSVLELGGGMTCLAGLLLAKYSSSTRVLLTDGNPLSVANVATLLKTNALEGQASASILDWASPPLLPPFDVVLAADCLFFDDSRPSLAASLALYLAPLGIAVLTAPKRGPTLDLFLGEASTVGLLPSLFDCYHPLIWHHHLSCLSSSTSSSEFYDPDIHYPLLIILTKVFNPPLACKLLSQMHNDTLKV